MTLELWALPVRGGDADVAAALLSPDERQHVARFRSRDAAVVAALSRAVVRVVLGARLAVPPHALRVDRACERCGAPHGRPRVPDASVAFSVSHSASLVVVAVGASGRLGVDVEPADGPSVRDVAELVLAPAELDALRGLDDVAQEAHLRRTWVRKEAVLKAYGVGLVRDPRTVTWPVTGTAAGPAAGTAPLRHARPHAPYDAVHVSDVAAHGHVGAVAAADPVTPRWRDARALLLRTAAAWSPR